jgi:hypothetical protein
VSTVFTAAAVACAAAAQLSGVGDGELDEVPAGEGEVLAEIEGEVLGELDAEVLGETLGLPETDGLGLVSVSVIVVTPFEVVAVAVTSAPVVPRRNTTATAPDFAWKNSSRSRSSIQNLHSVCSNEERRFVVRRIRALISPPCG